MTHQTRRKLLQRGGAAAAAFAFTGAPNHARAAEFTYKYGNNLPPAHPMNVAAKQAAERIREETNGRLDIQIFPSSQLGSDTDTLSQLRSGGVEFFTLSGLILSTLVPAAALNGIGFAFPDYDSGVAGHGRRPRRLRSRQIAKANLVAMDKIWDNGFRQITTSTKPINSPTTCAASRSACRSRRCGHPCSRRFDAAPASINASEMYTALQTKVVDGAGEPALGHLASSSCTRCRSTAR